MIEYTESGLQKVEVDIGGHGLYSFAGIENIDEEKQTIGLNFDEYKGSFYYILMQDTI